MAKGSAQDEPVELSTTGKIILRATESAAQLDKQVKHSHRLAQWIRRQLEKPPAPTQK